VAYALATNHGGALPNMSSELRLSMIKYMVSGVVRDVEEATIINIWLSFGVEIYSVAGTNNGALWKKTLQECNKLTEQNEHISAAFKSDILGLSKHYASLNRSIVTAEAARFGIDVEGGETTAPPASDHVKRVQTIGHKLVRLQKAAQELKEIRVGYNLISARGGPFSAGVRFDPAKPPEMGPDGTEHPPWPTWDAVMVPFLNVSAAIEQIANKYPTLFMLSQGGSLDTFVEQKDPVEAQEAVRQTLVSTDSQLKRVRADLDNGSIPAYDLTPVYRQLLTGTAVGYKPAYPWHEPYYREYAQADLDSHTARQVWADRGLSALSAVLGIAALITGGPAAAFLLGGGLGISAGAAALSWKKYLDYASRASASAQPGLAFTARPEVDDALLEAVVSSVMVFLEAYGMKTEMGKLQALRAGTNKPVRNLLSPDEIRAAFGDRFTNNEFAAGDNPFIHWTEKTSYLVRVGPTGKWGEHLFEILDEAEAYAVQLSRKSASDIRNDSALPWVWKDGTPGNPVDYVRIFEVPSDTFYMWGAAGPQEMKYRSLITGQPLVIEFPGGGPQVVIDRRIVGQMKEVATPKPIRQ
jgi:hypothetical protein